MAESRAHIIAQSLMQIARTFESEEGPARGGRPAGPPKQRDAETMASLIRALCPATSDTTRPTDVAELIRALCPANEARTDPAGVARLIQALSPAAQAGGRDRLQALIAALCPVEPEERISRFADEFAKGNVDELVDVVRSGLETEGATATAALSSRQRQAVDVFRVLWPIEQQPGTSVEDGVAFLRALCPADQPADQVASLIAALSPAADTTVSTSDDAVKLIRALCPAGDVPAADVAQLVRALSPADDATARRAENVAQLVRALCPADTPPATMGAFIRALSPAVDPDSIPTEVAKLIRELSPDAGPVEVIRTLSPAAPGE